jgi:hypothetical protein
MSAATITAELVCTSAGRPPPPVGTRRDLYPIPQWSLVLRHSVVLNSVVARQPALLAESVVRGG